MLAAAAVVGVVLGVVAYATTPNASPPAAQPVETDGSACEVAQTVWQESRHRRCEATRARVRAEKDFGSMLASVGAAAAVILAAVGTIAMGEGSFPLKDPKDGAVTGLITLLLKLMSTASAWVVFVIITALALAGLGWFTGKLLGLRSVLKQRIENEDRAVAEETAARANMRRECPAAATNAALATPSPCES